VIFRAALAAALLASVAVTPASAEVARSGQPVMGTVLTVTVLADDRSVAQALADESIEEARRWDDALTIWRPDGELAGLNDRAGEGFVDIGPRLVRGLAAMLSLADATGGAFDPAVGALQLAGGKAVEPIGRVLQLERSRASLAAGSLLDPGAIGKGLALDAIAGLLRGRGVTSAFLDFGGSSQTAIGVPPGDARGWSVVIAGSKPGKTHGVVKLRDASLSTSRAGAVDTTAIVDPRSGTDVPGPRLATVIAREATAADAWSTAVVVLGREGIARAEKAGIEVLYEDGGGNVRTKSFVTEPAERSPI
jgi:thiamine biosynthesis lipoprotein